MNWRHGHETLAVRRALPVENYDHSLMLLLLALAKLLSKLVSVHLLFFIVGFELQLCFLKFLDDFMH